METSLKIHRLPPRLAPLASPETFRAPVLREAGSSSQSTAALAAATPSLPIRMYRRLALASISLLCACGGGSNGDSLPPGDLFGGYAPASLELVLLQPIAVLAPVSPSPAIDSFTVTPPLPAGLLLDAATGEISGAAETLAPLTEYLITAESGSTQDSESLILSVRAPAIALASDAPLVAPQRSLARRVHLRTPRSPLQAERRPPRTWLSRSWTRRYPRPWTWWLAGRRPVRRPRHPLPCTTPRSTSQPKSP